MKIRIQYSVGFEDYLRCVSNLSKITCEFNIWNHFLAIQDFLIPRSELADRHLNKPILVEQTKSVYPKLLSTSTLFPDAWRNHEQTFTSNETHIQTSIVGLECL